MSHDHEFTDPDILAYLEKLPQYPPQPKEKPQSHDSATGVGKIKEISYERFIKRG
jgi:hypothetical protein